MQGYGHGWFSQRENSDEGQTVKGRSLARILILEVLQSEVDQRCACELLGSFYSGDEHTYVTIRFGIQQEWIALWTPHCVHKPEKVVLPSAAAVFMNYSWTLLKEYHVTAFVNWVQLINSYTSTVFLTPFPHTFMKQHLTFFYVKCSTLQIQ